jgi:hypothetical protein
MYAHLLPFPSYDWALHNHTCATSAAVVGHGCPLRVTPFVSVLVRYAQPRLRSGCASSLVASYSRARGRCGYVIIESQYLQIYVGLLPNLA